MSVNLNNGFFNCFSCAEAGSAVGFIIKMDACDLHTALAKQEQFIYRDPTQTNLTDEHTIALSRMTPSDYDFWTRRSISKATLQALGVGKDGIESYVFPYYDLVGRLTLFKIISSRDKHQTFWRPRGLRDALRIFNVFDIELSKPSRSLLLVCEGEKDTLAAKEMGFYAVGISGVRGFDSKYASLFTGTNVVVVMDNDEEGYRASKEIAQDIRRHADVKVIHWRATAEHYDLNDLLIDHGPEEGKRHLLQLVQDAEVVMKRVKKAIHVDLLNASEKALLTKIPHDSFIDQYVSYAAHRTDAPLIFHYTIALLLISAIMEGNVRLYLSTGTMKPNLWILLLGTSALYRKSTSLNIGMSILRAVDPTLLISSDFSPEGLLQELSEQAKGVICRDEFSGFLETASKREYMAGTKSTLMKLFDGSSFKRRLRKETVEVVDPYVVLLSATVDKTLAESLTTEDFYSGFAGRFLLIRPDKLRPRKAVTLVESTSLDEEHALISTLTHIRDNLKPYPCSLLLMGKDAETKSQQILRLELPTFIQVIFEKEVLERWNEMAQKLEEYAMSSPYPDEISPSLTRLGDYILKIATCFQAAETLPEEGKLTVEYHNLLRAAQIVVECVKSTSDIISDAVGRKGKFNMERILNIIRLKGTMTRAEVMNRCGELTASEMDTIVRTLVERGMIQEVIGTHNNSKSYMYLEPECE